MALERQIIANMHRAIEARDFNQVRAQEGFLEDLERAKQGGLVDYEDDAVVETAQALNGDPNLMLTGTQLKLLSVLSSRPNQVVGFGDLKAGVWGAEVKDATVYTAVSRLKRGLDSSQGRILNVKGIGYAFITDPGFRSEQ